MIANDPAWNQQMPLSYYLVKEKLEQEFAGTKNYIEREDFDAIASEIPVADRSTLLSGLSCLGICLWYPKIATLETLVLNPEWITNGIYRVINWLKNEWRNAEMSLDDFERIFSEDPVYAEKYEFLYNLMQVYELAYKMPNCDSIVVPQCLPEDSPPASALPGFPPESSLYAEFQVKNNSVDESVPTTIPPDVMPRFIVRRHVDLSNKKKHAWRYGAVMQLDDDAIALVQQDTYSIRLQVKGKRKSDYLEELRTALLYVLNSYEGLQRHKPSFSYRVISNDGRLAMLPNEEAYNLQRHFSPNLPKSYSDIGKNLILNVEKIASEYRPYPTIISIGTLYHGSPHTETTTTNTYNFYDCNVELQSSLRELANELPDCQEAKELRDAADLFEQAESSQSAQDVKKRGILPKIARCMDALNNENSTLRRIISGVVNGAALVGKILTTWNQVAQWCGVPSVPGV